MDPRKLVLVLLWLVVLSLWCSGCRLEPAAIATPTETPAQASIPPQPTQAPTRQPTTEPMAVAPTEGLEATAPAPTPSVPAPGPSVPAPDLPMPTHPPAVASVGETWTRPADGQVMVYVPAGEFEMGSNDPFYNNERPPHLVALAGFWLDETEVTNGQYRACVQAGGCKPPVDKVSYSRPAYYGDPDYDDYPVVYVNWYRAVTYCKWVGGRLPSEEEWEYAARGPEGGRYPWGDMPDGTRLNYCDANCPLPHADPTFEDGHPDTAPVGSYVTGASWCGGLDLVGNVWEWVWDWYGFYPSEDNPEWLAPEMQDRVIRGGAWDTDGEHARCTFRSWFDPAKAHDSIGFRCVLDAPVESAQFQP